MWPAAVASSCGLPMQSTAALPSLCWSRSLGRGCRYFETAEWEGVPSQWWYGGGTDITPSYVYDEDMKHFHGTYKKVCDNHDPEWYPRFQKWYGPPSLTQRRIRQPLLEQQPMNCSDTLHLLLLHRHSLHLSPYWPAVFVTAVV